VLRRERQDAGEILEGALGTFAIGQRLVPTDF